MMQGSKGKATGKVVKALCIVTISLVMYAHSSADTSSCGEKFSSRMDQDVFSKHRLGSRVVDSQPISRPFECYVKCMKNCRCLSYNVCNNDKLCELNSEKKENNISLYKQSDECDYYEYQFSKEDPDGHCLDPCCSTSQPCLNGARCQASCMTNQRRFQCRNCPEGYGGDRCENVPRSCAAYANSPSRQNTGYKVVKTIIAPDNTPYEVFCLFTEHNVRTLVMSYARQKSSMGQYPLSKNKMIKQNQPEWSYYRLPLDRMQEIRKNSTQWYIGCNFRDDLWQDTDSINSYFDDTDPLTYDSSAVDSDCRQVKHISIGGNTCSNCRVGLTQTAGLILHVGSSMNCGELNVSPMACGSAAVTYFGRYHCFNLSFRCTKTDSSTTQLWFSD